MRHSVIVIVKAAPWVLLRLVGTGKGWESLRDYVPFSKQNAEGKGVDFRLMLVLNKPGQEPAQ